MAVSKPFSIKVGVAYKRAVFNLIIFVLAFLFALDIKLKRKLEFLPLCVFLVFCVDLVGAIILTEQISLDVWALFYYVISPSIPIIFFIITSSR